MKSASKWVLVFMSIVFRCDVFHYAHEKWVILHRHTQRRENELQRNGWMKREMRTKEQSSKDKKWFCKGTEKRCDIYRNERWNRDEERVSWEPLEDTRGGELWGKKMYRERKREYCVRLCVKAVQIYIKAVPSTLTAVNSPATETATISKTSSSPFLHHRRKLKSLCDLLWRRVDEYTDSRTHGKTCPAALRSAYETNWLILLTWARTSFNIHKSLRLSVSAFNRGCDSILLYEIWLIFSESLLHEKQMSGEHPRQNVNDTKGDPRDYTHI